MGTSLHLRSAARDVAIGGSDSDRRSVDEISARARQSRVLHCPTRCQREGMFDDTGVALSVRVDDDSHLRAASIVAPLRGRALRVRS